ncbi:hypothetical protein ACH4MA_03905 [Streptomyces roseolus]|uniref:hypothetical protein n=1 Tax=Streptomyces roseolus TaxID=67358 RepID=UPI0037A08FB6
MIKNERLRRGLVVAGAVAAALGGGVGAAQAAGTAVPAQATAVAQDASGAVHEMAGDELPELGTPVAASGLTSGLDSVTEGHPVLVDPSTLTGALGAA